MCHKEAVEKMLALPATTKDLEKTVSSLHSSERAENRVSSQDIVKYEVPG